VNNRLILAKEDLIAREVNDVNRCKSKENDYPDSCEYRNHLEQINHHNHLPEKIKTSSGQTTLQIRKFVRI